jgi:hypothetical protein
VEAVLGPVSVHAAYGDLAELGQLAEDQGDIPGTDIVCVYQQSNIDIFHKREFLSG